MESRPTQRRAFLAGIGSAVALGSSAWDATAKTPPPIKPRRLRIGDTVALVAPAGYLDDAGIERRVRNLESLGLRVKYAENLRAARGNFAGTIAQRVSDLHDAFVDRDVSAIWAARGGSGASQLLPHLNYRLIAAHPKILIGFSDITALHAAILQRANLVTFHGPTAGSTFTDYTSRHLVETIMVPGRGEPIEMADANRRESLANDEFTLRVLRPGVASGRLLGGNLSVFSALTGTPYQPSLSGALAFFEEINEEPYRLDRMFTQLRQGAGMDAAKAVMLGVFRRCSPKPGDASLSLAETVYEHFGTRPRPAVYGYSIGHIAHQMTLPVGTMARLDTAAQTLTRLESAVL
jgi:muramoyltetrapeptide carboxypeptidase